MLVGPGMASVVCKYVTSPRIVVATDGDEQSIQLTSYNVRLNSGSSGFGSSLGELSGELDRDMDLPVVALSASCNIVPMVLYWGNTVHLEKALGLLTTDAYTDMDADFDATEPVSVTATRSAASASGDFPAGLGYDIVIMSDIVALVYTDAFDALLATMKGLCKPSTVLYLVYQRRHSSENQFFEKLDQCRCFYVTKLPRRAIHADFRHLPIFMYKLTPCC